MSVLLINQNTLNSFEKLSANIDPDKVVIAIQEAQDLDLRQFLGKAFYDDLIQYFSNAQGIASCLIPTSATTAANGNYINQALQTTGTGINAAATIQVINGRASKFTVTSPGSGYNDGDIITCAAIPNAIFTVNGLIDVLTRTGLPQTYTDLFDGKTYTDLSNKSIKYGGIVPALAYWSLARLIESMSFEYTSTGAVTKDHDNAKALSQKDITTIIGRQRSKANAKANDIEQFLYNNKGGYPLWLYNQRNKTSRQPGSRIMAIDITDRNGAYNGYYNDPYGLGGMING